MVNPAIAIILMASITYLSRVIPLTFFRQEVKSTYIRSFFRYVPFAVLGSLTFPEIFHSTGSLASAIVGCVVALILAYQEQSMMVVTMTVIFVVYIFSFLF